MLQVFQRSVLLAAPDRLLEGDLAIPESASGIAIFAHGSSAHFYNARHMHIAGALNQKGIATLMLDLLTVAEELSAGYEQNPRFAIDMLAGRLLAAREWLLGDQELRYLPAGYVGSHIGVGAAFVAAARQPERIVALVSPAGRMDLVSDILPQVRTPTLLIVPGDDVDSLLTNQKALDMLRGETSLRIVPHATSHFDEPGTLDDAARLTCDWFTRYFRQATQMKYGWADAQGRWV
ncbi:hydrolase [Vitiosangium sp. GDMCC 1.1324]|uniref:hydrolase n=1 Tax=Vitiosangium sp. (strain GDMCC 1.1324) TaxID=2138576 RepID=UPI000D38A051|nr:hydrolase [Vitiosangium sp. GDMCC 1.1324]PTL84772.1 hydrolase [Vitiosangium sp. GDMCC 1.1324]